jgi:DNA-binding CsgD family transcriptional regulator
MARTADAIERGRERYAGRRWEEAYEALAEADRSERLAADDLERLAVSAYMIGREGEYLDLLEREYRIRLEGGERQRALRSAFWIGVNLARRGEAGRASGWLSRAQRLLDQEEGECAEHGYMLLPGVFEHEARGEWTAAADRAGEAMTIGERHGDQDLFALLGHERGHCLIRAGRIQDGIAHLDEAMVAAGGGELSPIVTGIVYCGVVLACQEAHDPRRAREWTAVLSGWCEEQPEMVAFTGRCLIHRAEIMQLGGEWPKALEEARRAADRCRLGENPAAVGEALYREAEVHRLTGDLDAAESAFREASRLGREPQPGLSLLRLAQGERGAAAASIGRALEEAAEPGARSDLLPAQVEISLAVGDVEAAAAAASELSELASSFGSSALEAAAATSSGAVLLARGEPGEALPSLRRGADLWAAIDAPYESARARELIGSACRTLGDEDTAKLELGAAQAAFERLRAAADLERVESAYRPGGRAGGSGLTERELEVLRLVAGGSSNRQIAAALSISEHTVARHLQNIFAKLGVSSRTAASAFAFSHDLV